MQTDAERRLALAEKINGAEANLGLARSRELAARGAIDEIQRGRQVDREDYAEARAQLETKLTAQERLVAITRVNDALARLASQDAALQRARSEDGTAAVEVVKLEKEHGELVLALAKLLPELL